MEIDLLRSSGMLPLLYISIIIWVTLPMPKSVKTTIISITKSYGLLLYSRVSKFTFINNVYSKSFFFVIMLSIFTCLWCLFFLFLYTFHWTIAFLPEVCFWFPSIMYYILYCIFTLCCCLHLIILKMLFDTHSLFSFLVPFGWPHLLISVKFF